MLFHRNPAQIEIVATDPNNPNHAWYVHEVGCGVMIEDPAASGRTFIEADQLPECEDLEFVSRSETAGGSDSL